MAKTILINSRGNFGAPGTSTAGTTQYVKLAVCSLVLSANEAIQEIPYYSPGTISKLQARVIANTCSAPSTITVRKNRVDSPQQITIPAGEVGEFHDPDNVVTVAAGDKLVWKTVSGGTGTFTLAFISVIFDATTNCVVKFAFPLASITSTSLSQYLPLTGARSATATTEAAIEHTFKVPGTMKNAYLNVNVNNRLNPTTITIRKNRVGTPITFTYAAGEVATKQDLINTVGYGIDDKITWQVTTGVGTESMSLNLTIEFETTTGHGFITAGSTGASADITVAPSTTEYYTVGGAAIEGVTSEADAQMRVRERFTFSLLTLYHRANTITAPSTFTLRKNGEDTALSITIGPSAVGYSVDSIHTVDFEPNDLICYKLVTGATGTLLTFQQMAVWTLPILTPEVITGSGGGGQGRPPQYREVRHRDISIAIVRVTIPLEYEVEKLSVQVPLHYTIQIQRPIVKYASAVLSPIARILPLPTRPAPKPRQKQIVRLSIPLSYEVTALQVKAACSYKVDKLITREQQNKILTTSINFLLSDFLENKI